MGVLATAYLMMNREGYKQVATRAQQSPALRTEAAVDPALNFLFEMETGLERLPKPDRTEQKRVPTEAPVFKKKGPIIFDLGK